MSIINKNFTSQALAENVDIRLGKRVLPDGSDEYFGDVGTHWDGGRITIRKEVKLSELTTAERNALIAGASAMHALAVGKVTGDDF